MKKLFKKAIRTIKNNKEVLALGLIVSMVAPVVMTGVMLVSGYCYG